MTHTLAHITLLTHMMGERILSQGLLQGGNATRD